MTDFEQSLEKLDKAIASINQCTRRIKEIDKKIAWNKFLINSASEYFDSKQSGDYTGD